MQYRTKEACYGLSAWPQGRSILLTSICWACHLHRRRAMPTESAQAADSQRLRGVKVKGLSLAVDFSPP